MVAHTSSLPQYILAIIWAHMLVVGTGIVGPEMPDSLTPHGQMLDHLPLDWASASVAPTGLEADPRLKL